MPMMPMAGEMMVGAGMGAETGGGGSPLDDLRAAIEFAQKALNKEPDDADSMQLAAVVQKLYQILANRQKEQDQLLGNGPLRRTLSRAG